MYVLIWYNGKTCDRSGAKRVRNPNLGARTSCPKKSFWGGGEDEGEEARNINSCTPVRRSLERTPGRNLFVFIGQSFFAPWLSLGFQHQACNYVGLMGKPSKCLEGEGLSSVPET